MSKRFIAFVLAGALTITSISAQPVRAGNSDAEKFLLGLGALLVIGAAIDEAQRAEKKRKDKKKKKKRQQVVIHEPVHPSVRGGGRHVTALKPLPGYCLRNVRTYEGDRRIFGARCLQNNYSQVDRLPRRCKTFLEGPRGTRIGYRPKCLRRAGFSTRG